MSGWGMGTPSGLKGHTNLAPQGPTTDPQGQAVSPKKTKRRTVWVDPSARGSDFTKQLRTTKKLNLVPGSSIHTTGS